MKIAVTGANGFVGQAVLANLAARGIEAIPVVRRSSGIVGERVVGDLAGGGVSVDAIRGAKAVIHLAARTHVMDDPAIDAWPEYRKTNVEGTARLLDAAVAAGVERFVFMSSVKAVGEWSEPGLPLAPATMPRPEDAYGRSKLEAEALVKERCEAAGLDWAILRPPLVHGPGAKGNLNRLARLVARGIPLPLASIRNARSIVSVTNLADAAVTACLADGARGRILHIADLTLSTPELVRAIARSEGAKVRLVPVPAWLLQAAGRLAGRSAEISRLTGSLELDTASSERAMGWAPPIGGEAALGQTLASGDVASNGASNGANNGASGAAGGVAGG